MKPYIAAIAALVIIALLIFFIRYQNSHIVVTDYKYCSKKINKELDGFRILQISDFHNASFSKDNIKLISQIKNLSPDLIAITGDFVDSRHTEYQVSLSFAEELVKIAPVYYVTGNHEERMNDDEIRSFTDELEKLGVAFLDNETATINCGSSSFILAGLRDCSSEDNTLFDLMNGVSENTLSVLLSHKPHLLNHYADSGVDFVLSGHAHGGQIRIPYTDISFIAPDQGLFPKYTSGMHIEDSTTMIISRGVGNSLCPIRLFNYPEIVCIELKKVTEN